VTTAPAQATAPEALTPPPGNPRFPLFDSLRAIAALCVLVTHASFLSGAHWQAWYGQYTARLDVGVTIFFLISGFLLYRPFVSARLRGTPRPGWAEYARRRALRILPAYWVALTVLALTTGLPQMWSAHSWSYYALVQNLDEHWIFGGLTVAWSLAVEASFYVFLPLFAWLVIRARPRASVRAEVAVVAGLYLLGWAFRAGARAFEGDVSTVFVTLPGLLDWFALGMGLAVASVALEGRARMPAAVRLVERRPELSWLVAIALFWFLCTQIGLELTIYQTLDQTQWFIQHLLYSLVALFLLLPAVFGHDRPGGLPRVVLRNRVLAWLGLISYGLFLYHLPLLGEMSALDVWGSSRMLGITLSGLALAVACAAASYYVVERPLLRLKNGRRRRPRPAAAAGRAG
jgi:peptidoglycan/LPS O-acetylase OafA/YrhL